MNVTDFKEQHGEEVLKDLFLTKVIYGTVWESNQGWLDYAKKHKFCSKGGKYALPNYYAHTRKTETYIDAGVWKVRDIEPVTKHTFSLRNGKSENIIFLEITDEEYKHYMGE